MAMRTRLHLTVMTGVVATMVLVAQAAPRLFTPEAPVAEAAMRGDVEAVRALLRDGADVNAAQGDGMTALHWAALNGNVELMSLVLYAGATAEPLTRLGAYTPLHLASSRGHAAAVARLLDAGSTPGRATATGVQPIHLAAQAGNPDALVALLDRGVDVNVKDETHGRTPLVFATSQNRLTAMQLLITRGADITETTNVVDYVERWPPRLPCRRCRGPGPCRRAWRHPPW
jgi:ankyrin repeat protein